MGLFNWLFRRMTDLVFNQVDYNDNGKIEPQEIELAIYKLYNIINKRLPGWQDPPSVKEIQDQLKAFDEDENGVLDKAEFNAFARSMLKAGPDQFFSRVGRNAVTKTAMLPGATHLIQQSGMIPGIKNTPLAVLSPAVGCTVGAIRGLIPV